MEEIFDIFKRNFPYISREEKTLKEISTYYFMGEKEIGDLEFAKSSF